MKPVKRSKFSDFLEVVRSQQVNDYWEHPLLTVKLHGKGLERSGKKPNKTPNPRPYFPRHNGELLVGRQNFHNGSVAVVSFEEDGYICSSAISSFRVKSTQVSPEYFKHYILRPDFYKKVGLLIGGTGQKEISVKDFLNLSFVAPDFKDQVRIADFLSSVDAKLDALSAKKESLKGYKKGLMQKLFSREIRFTREDGSVFPDWEERRCGDVIYTVPTSKNKIKSSEIKTIGEIQVIDQGEKIKSGYTSDKSKVLPNKRSIIFGDHTTNLKLVSGDFVVGADGVKVIRSKKCDVVYIYQSLLHNRVKSEGYKRHFSMLKMLNIGIPHPEEQTRIAEALSALDEKIDAVSAAITQMEVFKKGLLQKLFV